MQEDISNIEIQNSQHYQVNPGNMIRKKTQHEMIMPSFSKNYFRKESMDNNEQTNEQVTNAMLSADMHTHGNVANNGLNAQ